MTQRTRPAFPREASGDLYRSLKQRAEPIIAARKRRAQLLTWSQVILFPGALVITYALLLLEGENLVWFYACYAAFGAIVTFMVLNVVHDAVHHCLFEKSLPNKIAAHALDIVGANSFIWGRRHVQLHHTYTNIPGWDVDIEDRTVIRLAPTDKLRWAHRYQHIYVPFLYPFYTLNWLFLRDTRDCFSKTSLVGRTIRVPAREAVKLFAFKAVYLTYIVIVPALVLAHAWYHFVIGFVLMHAFTGVLTLIIVLPTHFDENAPFPQPDADARMEDAWAVHQIRTTNDFSTNRPLFTYLLGGLNHHAAHHLFPAVNHNHLPALTRLVVTAAEEQNISYKSFTYPGALRSHFRLLKRNGVRVSDIFNE
jgi:linoleoyl-CoA desaturase